MDISVIFGEKKLKVKKGSTFLDLKKIILKQEGILAKYFILKDTKINEFLMISNFPEFDIIIDPNKFQEYKKGHYRCSSCYKYVKQTKWCCAHTAKCKAKYLFSGEFIKKIKGGYDIDEEIDSYFISIDERRKKNMLNKINEIIGFK